MEILRDQSWNGVAALAAVAMVVATILIEREKLKPLGSNILPKIISALVGTLIMSLGPWVQLIAWGTIQIGAPATWIIVTKLFTEAGGETLQTFLVFGLLTGTATAMAALGGKGRSQKIKRAIVMAIVSTTVFDTLDLVIGGAPINTVFYLFSILSNVVGGIAAGWLIGSIVEFVAEQYSQPI